MELINEFNRTILMSAVASDRQMVSTLSLARSGDTATLSIKPRSREVGSDVMNAELITTGQECHTWAIRSFLELCDSLGELGVGAGRKDDAGNGELRSEVGADESCQSGGWVARRLETGLGEQRGRGGLFWTGIGVGL